MNHLKEKGFTLIETLVAISILMIAIAGPLTVATKGYTASIEAKNQSIAMNLAQEGMEYLNNIKDNRLWGNWVRGSSFYDNNRVSSQYSSCSASNICTLGEISGTWGPTSGFSRTHYFRVIDQNSQVVAVVSVSWNAGTKKVEVEQVLTNSHR